MLNVGTSVATSALAGSVTGMSVGIGVRPSGRLLGPAHAPSSKVRPRNSTRCILCLIGYLLSQLACTFL